MQNIEIEQQRGAGAGAAVRDFVALCKPRVLLLIMLTAAVGALLAAVRYPVSPPALLLALVGIGGVAAAAAAFNCLVEAAADGVMRRTRRRPLPCGRLATWQAVCLIVGLGGGGMALTTAFGGALAGVLTGVSFFGYAVVYTLFLKYATPQNIVIGGASGAMPPLLGWVAASGQVGHEPLLLFLIVFVWTPPHFWALALYRRDDYARAGTPMLPVTHGALFTATQILLYTVILFGVALLPFLTQMAGWLYLAAAVPLNVYFFRLAKRLRRTLAGEDGRKLFVYSVWYLAGLFAALLVDALVTAAW